MSLGLWAWAAQTVLSRGFYALGKTWEPTLLGTLTVIVTYPLYHLMAQRGALGLAAASSVAISTYCVLLVWRLRRHFPHIPDEYGRFLLRIVPAVAVGIGAGLGVRLVLSNAHMLARGSLAGGAGVLVFAVVAHLLRLPELRDVVRWGLRKARMSP
jgi:putative peptidoglycan lipid II flippase